MDEVRWNAVVFKKDGRLHGQVVEHALDVHGDTVDDVRAALAETVASDLAWSLEHGVDVRKNPTRGPLASRARPSANAVPLAPVVVDAEGGRIVLDLVQV